MAMTDDESTHLANLLGQPFEYKEETPNWGLFFSSYSLRKRI